mmetsp:Transcript_33246/g.82305  ORF Transcript_33246/g.82305 Transcript_33246/m.82305 type:complete len:262 (+) Transcript_33246:927-1712(+)
MRRTRAVRVVRGRAAFGGAAHDAHHHHTQALHGAGVGGLVQHLSRHVAVGGRRLHLRGRDMEALSEEREEDHPAVGVDPRHQEQGRGGRGRHRAGTRPLPTPPSDSRPPHQRHHAAPLSPPAPPPLSRALTPPSHGHARPQRRRRRLPRRQQGLSVPQQSGAGRPCHGQSARAAGALSAHFTVAPRRPPTPADQGVVDAAPAAARLGCVKHHLRRQLPRDGGERPAEERRGVFIHGGCWLVVVSGGARPDACASAAGDCPY